MNRAINISLFFALLIFTNGKAQQLPMYSNYLYKPFVYNPSFAGDQDQTEIFAMNRNQFSDFQGSPAFNVLSVDSKLQKKKTYAGFLVANQRKGIMSNTNVMATYAYRLNFDKDIYFKFGLSMGLFDQSMNFSKILVQNYADPDLLNTQQHKTTVDGNAGISLYYKKLSLGLAMPQILAGKLDYASTSSARSYYQMARHFAFSAKYELPVNKEKEIYLVPNAIVRMVKNAPLQYDAGLTLDWKDKCWLGVFYRSGYAVGINAGATINRRFSVGYSYDYMVGSISKYAGVSQEIMLAVKIGKLRYRKGDDTLTEYDKKIIELQRQMEELKMKNAQYSQNLSDTSKPIINTNIVKANPTQFSGKNVSMEKGIYVLTNKAPEFMDAAGSPVPKGIYLVVESCFDRDYAIDESKRYASFGFPDSDVIIDKSSKFHYVIIETAESKEDAVKKVHDAKGLGVPDVWIQILTE
ncbi:MAG: type IX secretion system membrane protein PorP/SprF [Bacteroidia bacterium]